MIMIELKYKITDADIRAEDKRNCLEFFAVYAAIGILGLAVGIVAVVLRQSIPLLALGIIMIALAALLCIIAILLAIPHNPTIKSVVFTDDAAVRTVTLGERELSVSAEDGTNIVSFGYARFIGMRKRKDYIRLTLEKNVVLLVKCGSQELEKTYSFILDRMGKKKTRKQSTAQPIEISVAVEKTETDAAETQQTGETESVADNEIASDADA